MSSKSSFVFRLSNWELFTVQFGSNIRTSCWYIFMRGSLEACDHLVWLSFQGPSCLHGIPGPPEPPMLANIDVTSMCALVSEVSHGRGESALVRQWAERVDHWKECLEVNQKKEPEIVLCCSTSDSGYALGPLSCTRWEDRFLRDPPCLSSKKLRNRCFPNLTKYSTIRAL